MRPPSRGRLLPAALVAFVAVSPAAARQDAPLVTDRPDFTESALTVPRGSVQLETGLTVERASGTGTVSGPEALVRWSPASKLELRLAAPNYVTGEFVDGLGDVGVGVKIAAGRGAGWDLAGIASLSLPTGPSSERSSVSCHALLL